MKKRFGFLSLFAVTALLLVVVGAVAALAAPSAADPVTGTVEFDEDWYTIDSVVTITITDADANTISTTLQIIDDADTIPAGGDFSNMDPFDVLSFSLNDIPVVGDLDLFESTAGVRGAAIPAATLSITALNRANGFVTVQAGGGGYTAGDFQVDYAQAQVNDVNVTIVSDQDPVGLTLIAAEADAINDDNEFTVTIRVDALTTTPLAGPPGLFAPNTNEIKATYKDTTPSTTATFVDVSASANVETDEPTFSNLLPEDGFATQTTVPIFTGIIIDSGGSGLDVATILITVGGVPASPVVTGEDGDDSVTYTFTPPALTENVIHSWSVSADDLAGNTGVSDADPDDGEEDQDDHMLNVDGNNPVILSAETGKYYDSVAKEEKSDKLDRLVLIFDDDIDGDSVTPADFTVEGLPPIDTEVVDERVYLTLSEDLAADAEPFVAIASGGSVSDEAGNSLTAQADANADATDEIAPTYTVTLDTTLTDDEVVITVSSNEKGSVPTVKVHNISGDAIKILNILVKTSTSWEATFSKSATHEGENSVVVSGLDKNNNTAEKGDATITSGDFEDDAIVFTLDTTVPVVNFEPADEGEVTSTAPFITLTFFNGVVEVGKEEKVVVDSAVFGPADGDLADVTADGRASTDQETWIYKASGLTVGDDYTIKVTITDLAGNETEDAEATFTVDEPDLEEIALIPGSNLVSLSGDPADPDINAVITLLEVTSVITYDPVNPDPVTGPWKTATRDSSGNLSGPLDTIDAQHAYWVSTSSFEPIEVEVEQLGAGAAIPPSIALVGGWNLVPVVNVSGDAAIDVSGDTGLQLNADTYFGSTAWVTAYTWDTQGELWVKVLPGTFDDVTVGKGYWLYVTEAGILVP